MALMRLIRYISDVKSFHSMILMGDLLVVEIKAHEKFHIIETFHTFADILGQRIFPVGMMVKSACSYHAY